MKKNKNNMFVCTLFMATLMLSAGFIVESKDDFMSLVNDSDMNLVLSEVDTKYDNDDYIEKRKVYTKPTDTRWMWPTDTDFYITSKYSNSHPAIDIVPNKNINAFAVYNGTVITNSYKSDNGNYLVIKTDDNKYLMYAHLSEKFVKEKERVKKGQIIGIIGRTGNATGVHLHFAVWEGYPHRSKPINPFSMY